MSSVLRLALMGTGRAARARAREVALSKESSLVVVASADAERAATLAAEHQCESTGNWLAAIARTDVDAVIVSTYNERHAEIVEAALQAGKHVCVEYPLALSLREGERLLTLVAEQRRVLHVEHIDLLSPWFQTVQAALPEVGELRSLLWQDISARQPHAGDWTFLQKSGFSLFAGASLLSRIVYLAGPVAAVDAAENLDGQQPDGSFQRRLTSAHLRFSSGATGLICDGSGFAAAGPSSALTLIGTQGILSAEHRKQVLLTTAAGQRVLPVNAGPTGLFAQDLSSFCGQVLRGEESYVPPNHVRSVLTAAELAQVSVRAKQ